MANSRPGESSAERLAATVIAGGYCVGCGGCAAVSEKRFEIGIDDYGKLGAKPVDTAPSQVDFEALCPFGAEAADEDAIGADLYPEAAIDPRIGRHGAIWSGYVAEGEFRIRGSSGGMGNWIASELLRTGKVDQVIHVRPDADGRLFGFKLSDSVETLSEGGKSRYYPIEMSSVLAHMRDNPGRYALVGVPCFIKALRLHQRANPVLAERVVHSIALVCGHLKSTRFAGMFAWQLGVHPDALRTIDFRVKNQTGRADHYSVRVTGQDAAGQPVERLAQNKSMFGYLWGHGFFKYRACDYCDDVFGETADVTVGDAWLPGLADDPLGTNVVVARHPAIEALIAQGISDGRLALEPLSADAAAKSQDAGLRHRRQGLSVRLADAQRAGRWIPPKRVAPGSDELTERQRWVYRIRERMSAYSHVAFAKALRRGSFASFQRRMRPWMDVHDFVNRGMGRKKFLRAMVGWLRF